MFRQDRSFKGDWRYLITDGHEHINLMPFLFIYNHQTHKTMKRTVIFMALAAMLMMFNSCYTVKQIGDVNMISERNIDSKFDYQRITTYSGGSKRQLRKSRAENLQQAVAQTVKQVPGGEFIMNAKAYIIKHRFSTYFAVEGDVWGHPVTTGDYQGYKLGDRVMFSDAGIKRYGKIVAIKDSEKCIVEDDHGRKHTVRYDKLMRSFTEE